MSAFNKYNDMPQIPYKILLHLMESNNNLFKLLKYNTKDALQQPILTFEEKRELLYIDEESEDEFRIFLKPLIGDEITIACTQLRFYKLAITPTNNINSVLNYEFDILCGEKMSIVYDENGIPCSRIDLIERELLQELNGYDAFGVGYFQFNRELSRACAERIGMSNSKTFFGTSLVLGCNYISTDGKDGVCE